MATRHAVVSLHVELLLRQGLKAEAFAVARHGRSRIVRQLERSNHLANMTLEEREQWDSLWKEYQERRAQLEERASAEWALPENEKEPDRNARKAEAEAIQEILDRAVLIVKGPSKKRSEGQLSPPLPGELILSYEPLSQGWEGFAASGKTIEVRHLELPRDIGSLSAEEKARLLLVPFRASIEKAKRIRILPSGPLLDVDFHALPFGEGILLEKVPVVYGLDLSVSTRSRRSSSRHALLVTDPQDNLPGASIEARNVVQALESGLKPWTTEELKGEQASPSVVQERLAIADLVHYAGHGIFSGLGGWDSGLLLAEDTQLTLGDILALERVPTWVVLSSCDTGRSSSETPVASPGLAQAFLLAGSQAVVASTRPAVDPEMPAFFTDLYEQWGREPDLAVALQRAQLSWRKRNPKADWQGFRLFVP